MATAADHFTAFVDRISGLDRVARAVAGESLARFRGRILLERAAHLMVATDRTLLDIAVDSGFAGHSDFARAFRREHGVLPSEWRAEPTSYVVDAPNDVHFHPRAGLVLPARQRMDGVDLVVEMVEHHVRVVGGLVDRAARLPDDSAVRPVLTDLVERMARLTARVHDAPEDDASESLRARLDRAGPDFVAAVALLGATGRFDEAFVDAFSPDPATTTFGAEVAAAVTDADDLLRTARTRIAELEDRA